MRAACRCSPLRRRSTSRACWRRRSTRCRTWSRATTTGSSGFPYPGVALARSMHRASDEPPQRVRTSAKLWLQEYVRENAVVGAFCRYRPRLPAPCPWLNKHAAQRLASRHATPTRRPRVRQPGAPCASRRWSTQSRARTGREGGRGPSSTWVERRRLPVTFPIEVRFTAGDDALAVHGPRPRDCLHRGPPVPGHGVRDLLPRRGADHVTASAAGPHWGKRHYQSAATLAPSLPGVGPLRRVCAIELDPDRRYFEKRHTRPRAGPGGGRGVRQPVVVTSTMCAGFTATRPALSSMPS